MADGYFDEGSPLRRVVGQRALVLAGGRTLLMQAAHPLAFAGLMAHTGSLDEPYDRLARTAQVLNAIAFGSRAEADRLTRRVRAMHRRVRGRLRAPAGRFPAGTPYAADDPELLLWVLAAIADSGMLVYHRYVRALSSAEREALWADYRVVGARFGLRAGDMPASLAEFDAYMRSMLEGDVLHVTPHARSLGLQVVMRPPVALPFRPLVELVNQITIGLLPPAVRDGIGLSWDPAREVALRGGAEYVRRVLIPLLPDRVRVIPPARAAAA